MASRTAAGSAGTESCQAINVARGAFLPATPACSWRSGLCGHPYTGRVSLHQKFCSPASRRALFLNRAHMISKRNLHACGLLLKNGASAPRSSPLASVILLAAQARASRYRQVTSAARAWSARVQPGGGLSCTYATVTTTTATSKKASVMSTLSRCMDSLPSNCAVTDPQLSR